MEKDEAHGSADSPIVIDSDESCSQSSPVGIGADREGRKREGERRLGPYLPAHLTAIDPKASMNSPCRERHSVL